jgi:anti-sigma regulatory factor (Ser/Thr protein kinase)
MSDIGLVNNSPNSFSFVFIDDINEIKKLEAIIDIIGKEWNIIDKYMFTLNLVLEELITNIIFYGFIVKDSKNTIKVDIERKEEELVITIMDNAMEFNILEKKFVNSKSKALDKQKIGGLGIHLVKNMTSSIKYYRENGFNYLTLSIIILDESS